MCLQFWGGARLYSGSRRRVTVNLDGRRVIEIGLRWFVAVSSGRVWVVILKGYRGGGGCVRGGPGLAFEECKCGMGSTG